MFATNPKIAHYLFAFLALFLLTNCTEEISYLPNPFLTTTNWSIKDVNITCKDPAKCPINHGGLFFVTENTYSYSVSRCTGVLISPTKLLTGGHCVEHFSFKDNQTAYFITPKTLSKDSHLVKIQKVLKTHNDIDVHKLDYALLELSRPIYDVPYANLSLEQLEDFAKVSAIVVNPKSNSKINFTLDQVECRQSKTSTLIPAFIHDNFNIFAVKNCKIYSGNSGGAITIEKDFNKLLGIIQASSNAVDVKRTADSPDNAVVANARCFDIPYWNNSRISCKETNEELTNKMVKKYLVSETMVRIIKLIENISETVKTEARTIQLSYKVIFMPKDVPDSEKFYLLPYVLCTSPNPKSNQDSQKTYGANFQAKAYEIKLIRRIEDFEIKNIPTKTLTGQWMMDLSTPNQAIMATKINEMGITYKSKSLHTIQSIAQEKRTNYECKGNDLKKYLKDLEVELHHDF